MVRMNLGLEVAFLTSVLVFICSEPASGVGASSATKAKVQQLEREVHGMKAQVGELAQTITTLVKTVQRQKPSTKQAVHAHVVTKETQKDTEASLPPTATPVRYPRDCEDIQQEHNTSGVYTVSLNASDDVTVYCDQDTDGGGWTVIQSRHNGSENFNRSWAEYEAGFGSLHGEYWLGLLHIYRLTKSREYSLRVDLWDFDGDTAFALYDSFYIYGPDQDYRLHIRDYSGTAGDSLSTGYKYVNLNNIPFSTPDRDNDMDKGGSCAASLGSGWWFNLCHLANLNGQYGQAHAQGARYLVWFTWHEDVRSYQAARMSIRRRR